MTTTATGTRDVPEARAEVWRALAVLQPYCPVCDVSYVVSGSGARTTFVCAPGRLDGGEPPSGAPVGRIVEWRPARLVTTRLELTPETWTTRIEFDDAPGGGTRVTMTVTHEPREGARVTRWLQRAAGRRMVQRTVDTELEKVPAHIAQLTAG